MASRPVVQQHARGEAAIGGVKEEEKKMGAALADGNNRKALGDIGNLVTVRGMDPKPNRPITRSFCAQLLANAQAAAAAENNKKKQLVAEANDVVAAGKKAGLAPKPTQKKQQKPVTVVEISPDSDSGVSKSESEKEGEEVSSNKKQQKPVTVVEISPDSDSGVNKPESKKEGEEVSSKKKQKSTRTLTSVLTARSKAACGVTNKPKEENCDIDSADAGNELAVVEYMDDMYKFYKLVENESRPRDYMDSQPEINSQMRSILVDWLVDVHNRFELSPETFYLTINIIDRYLAAKKVMRKELQLVGVSAMLMASKYEEIWAPEVNDFVCLSERAYSHEQILKMEKLILGKLEWTLTVPTPYVFLVRFIKASKDADSEMENMVYFLAELGMMHYSAVIMYSPSMIAASAVYAARCTLNRESAWTETLKYHSGFSESQLIDCAKLLVCFHAMTKESRLQVVRKKYSASDRGAVALLLPADKLVSAALQQDRPTTTKLTQSR